MAASGKGVPAETPTTSPREAPVAEQVQLATEVYIYGYPLVYNVDALANYVAGGGSWPMKAPYNQFGHARELSGPETTFVSPNNDTCYSIAACDVRREPLVLHVPDTADRYYVDQFIDAWSNNFAYIGRRATGTSEAEYLLAERGYAGEVPTGMRVIHVPTGVFLILGRLQVNGEADLPAVHVAAGPVHADSALGPQRRRRTGTCRNPDAGSPGRQGPPVVGEVPGSAPGFPSAPGGRPVHQAL